MLRCNLNAENDLPANDAAFDVWLRETLAAAFDPAIYDPVPDEMLAILMAAAEPRAAKRR